MKVLIFDTETTGLPTRLGYDRYYDFRELKYYDDSRIVSIAWNFYDNFNLINSSYYIVKPKNFIIDNTSIACKINKITNEIANKDGIDIEDIILTFHKYLYECDVIVAHNLLFDKNILLSELSRYKREDLIQLFESKQTYCTMLNTKNLLKIPMKYSSNFKSPKLIELYQYLFKEEFDEQHNALADVNACAKCYFKLLKL